MSIKCKVLLLLSCVLLLVSSSWADELVSVKAGYQLLSPSGSIAGNSTGTNQKLDVEDDLDLDNSENVTAEVAFQWGNTRLTFNYLPIEFSGTGTLTAAGLFNGQAFSVDDTVRSKLQADLYDIGYTYYLVNADDLPVRFQLGLELAVKVVDADVSFNDLDAGFTETGSWIIPIPTVGARTRIALADFVGLVGRVGYLEYDGHHFLDAEAQIEFSPVPTVGLHAGYRYFDMKIDDEDILLETKFSGPFAGLFVRF